MTHKELFSINEESFLIDFNGEELTYEGKVYPVLEVNEEIEEEPTWVYINRTNGEPLDQDAGEQPRILFEFSFTHSNMWEGKIFFSDDRYWSEELKTINIIWDHIEIILKEKIRSLNPGYEFYD